MKMNRDLLKKIYLFQNLTNSDLDQVLKIAERESFKAGDLIFKEGDQGDKLYIIMSGQVRISRKMHSGEEEALSVLKEGDFFGEMSLIDDIERSADAIANAECTLLSIKRDDFESLLFINKDIAHSILWAFTRTLSMRLRETNEKLKSIMALKGNF
jgi:CRP/FNR family cyclic AMP-dependent transcriptional regulator